MASPLSEMLDYLWKPPRNEPAVKSRALNRFDVENFKYYRNWGFTIYRTYYGQSSDKHWNTLLNALRQQTRLAVGYYDDKDIMENDKYWKQGPYKKEGRYMAQLDLFKELFHLFPRDDLSLLDGLDIRGIREVCLKEHAEAKKRMEGARFCFALVADEAAVGYDWTKTEGGWGWDRLRTGDLLDLWEMLLISHAESRSKYYDMRYDTLEEDLERNVWLGDFGLPFFGDCSRVDTVLPKAIHSSVDT
ncbi:hypothetical protein FOXYS1_15553 [Fusarium oxysporum]|uniref:Uncharacterized protein n=1 Tax=Fusarium oxysporum TaxID=5507 RepID=A0A8H4Z166_FUSOX|nr:hypothetical protein FOXYS1_15553 [Fusarium oxysporum]